MDISVVIPAYNAAAFIERALRSVLGQSRVAAEVLVVDDGSSDGTAALADSLGAPVRCVRQRNAGAAAARNRGVREARCEWVAFLDADDEWMPTKLERQAAVLEANPGVEWATCGFVQHDMRRESRIERVVPGGPDTCVFEDALVALGENMLIHTDTMLFSRALFERVGGNDESLRMGEDLDLWVRMGLAAPRLAYVNELLAEYHCGKDVSFSRSWAGDRVSPSPAIRKLAAVLAEAPAESRKGGRRLVARVLHGVFSTVLGNAPRALCREYVVELERHGFGPVPGWMKVCTQLPFPVTGAMRRVHSRWLGVRRALPGATARS